MITNLSFCIYSEGIYSNIYFWTINLMQNFLYSVANKINVLQSITRQHFIGSQTCYFVTGIHPILKKYTKTIY